MNLTLTNIANEVVVNYKNTSSDQKITSLLRKLYFTEKEIQSIEKSTREQSDSNAWKEHRKGRLTASEHHELYSKFNTISKVRSPTHPKTALRSCSIIFPDDKSKNLEPVKWGRDNEGSALKAFYVKEDVKHIEFKLENAGLFLDKDRGYIGASPDGIMYCKCYGKSILEVKWLYNICNSFIKEDIDKCSFLSTDNGGVTINKGHKYYTQVISQIQHSKSNQAYFIVWTTKDSFIKIVGKNEAFWEKLSINLNFLKKRLRQGCWQSIH